MALSNYVPRYTVKDHAMWEGEWELWSGVPVAMSPSPGMAHQVIAGRLFSRLTAALERADCSHCRVVPEIDWRVSEDTVIRPDLLIVCHHALAAYVSKTPAMVVEVLSDSTRQKDLLYKRQMYEELGVSFYLIVDPEGETTLLRREGERFRLSQEWKLRIDEGCEIELDLSQLFFEL